MPKGKKNPRETPRIKNDFLCGLADRDRRRLLRAGVFAAAIVISAAGLRAAPPGGGLATSELVIETWRGERLSFQVEVADTRATREQGLQGRQQLAEDAGMLFDFVTDQFVTMWMKDTPLPLDMLFIGPGGTIHKIVAKTTPYSLDPIPSDGAVRAVLEVRGGTAARLDIKVGDRVVQPVFTPEKAR